MFLSSPFVFSTARIAADFVLFIPHTQVSTYSHQCRRSTSCVQREVMQKRRRRQNTTYKVHVISSSVNHPQKASEPEPEKHQQNTQQSETHTRSHSHRQENVQTKLHTTFTPYNMHAYNVHLQIPYPPSEHRWHHTQKHYVTMLLHMCTRCPSVFLYVCV